jgi:ABC-type multidrug transport system fused ATPase/permease subunit
LKPLIGYALKSLGLKNFVVLICIFTISALLEISSVYSLYPFIDFLQGDAKGYGLYYEEFGQITGLKSILPPVWVAAFLTIVLLTAPIYLKGLSLRLSLHAVAKIQADLESDLLNLSLSKSIDEFNSVPTSNIAKDILAEIELFCKQVMLSVLNAIANLSVICVLVIVSLAWSPAIVNLGIGAVVLFYAVYFVRIRRIHQNLGEIRGNFNKMRFKLLLDSLNLYRENKIYALTERTLQRYRSVTAKTVLAVAQDSIVRFKPRQIFEATILVGGVFGLSWIAHSDEQNLYDLLPQLAMILFGVYKFSPSIYQFYRQLTLIKFHEQLLNKMVRHISDLQTIEPPKKPNRQIGSRNTVLDIDSICFSGFSVGFDEAPALTAPASFTLPGSGLVIVCGKSGSGKTTFCDTLLGLRPAKSGSVKIESSVPIQFGSSDWISNIGFVPQKPVIFSGTINENMLLLEGEEIAPFIFECAQKLQIAFGATNREEFGELVVGADGFQLSGGEASRLNLLRALARSPRIIILDEVTSSLDEFTSDVTLRLLTNMNILTILVSHRISDQRYAQGVLKIEDGMIRLRQA